MIKSKFVCTLLFRMGKDGHGKQLNSKHIVHIANPVLKLSVGQQWGGEECAIFQNKMGAIDVLYLLTTYTPIHFKVLRRVFRNRRHRRRNRVVLLLVGINDESNFSYH